jgi:alkylation response protein AidB-like acyl-CoA dehydrogenase
VTVRQVSAPDTSDSHSRDLERFRADVVAWLAANAVVRSNDADTRWRPAGLTEGTIDEQRARLAAGKHWQRRVYEAGFAGLTIPSEYGGRGLTTDHERVWYEELAGYDVDTAGLGLGVGLMAPAVLVHGTEAQRRRFIPRAVTGEDVWCQLFSEPGAGSDLAGLTTRAERDGDEWIVNGQKVWNSFAHLADWAILLARTDWDVPKHRGITYFLVDMRTPGVDPRPLRQATGVAEFNETFLTDVRIPAENVVGEVGGGWAVAQTTLMHERSRIGVGASRGTTFSDWLSLARGHGRTTDPVVRQQLAAKYTRTKLLEWLGMRARANARGGGGPGAESSVAKLFASLDLGLSGDLAMALEGPAAMLSGADAPDGGFWQHGFLGQWSPRIGGGTEQIQRNIIGERVLGLPAEARVDKGVPFRETLTNARPPR